MSIHLNPSHKGLLHKKLGIPQDKPIPASKLKIKSTDSPALKKEKQFAKNAKKFKKADDGLSFQPSNNFTSVFDYQSQAPGYQPQRPPQYLIPEENKLQDVPVFTPSSSSVQDNKKNKDIPWQQYLAPALTAIDALIPKQKVHLPYLQPTESYNPYSQGTGSTILAKEGTTVNPPYKKELYNVLGNNGQQMFDQGWMPLSSTTSGSVSYQNRYGLMNNAILPQGKGKVTLTAHPNGSFDAMLLDDKGNPFGEKLLSNANYSDVQNYFKNLVGQRAEQVGQGTDKQVDGSLIAKMEKGGKMWSSKKKCNTGMKVEGDQYTQLSPSVMQINGNLHENGGTDIQYGSQQVEAEKGETAIMDRDGALTILGNLSIPGTDKKFKTAGKELADMENKYSKKGNKYSKLLQDADDPFSFNAAKVGTEGAGLNLKGVQQQKEMLSALQEKMLAYAQHKGEDPKELFSGKQAKYGMKVKADGGKKIPLQDKYKALQENVLASLKTKYPGQNFEIKNSSDYRDIPTQIATAKKNGFSPTYSLHNLGAAEDFNIYQNGKMLDEKSPLYKQVLHPEAQKLGLYNLNRADDPFHISPVQEGQGHSFSDLLQNYPEVAQSDNYKKGFSDLEAIVNSGRADKTQIAAYEQLTGNKGNHTPGVYDGPLPKLDGQIVGETVLPGLKLPDQWMPKYPNLPDIPVTTPPPYQYNPQGGFNITPPSPGRKIPTNQQSLGLMQVLPELYGIASNKVEGVKMQQYSPDLYQPYNVSFQDRLNNNNSTFRSMERVAGNNPEALSVLAAQTYDANGSALADQFRTNQGIQNDVTNKNISLLNDAQLKNLQLEDNQYTRQQQAISNTRAINHSTLDSISSKYLQNAAANRKLGLYENLYDYRFDNNGKSVNYNSPIDFSSFGSGYGNDGATNPYSSQKVTTDKNGNLMKTETTIPPPITFPTMQNNNSPFHRFQTGKYGKVANGGIVRLTK